MKRVDNKTVTAGFLVSIYVLAFIGLSLSSAVDLSAQQRGTISVVQANALPLVNAEGNQVKVVINYSMGSEELIGERINAIMGIYDRVNGSLIKLSSFPDGFILNDTKSTIHLASTLTDPNIQNISTIVTLTNADKTEKYSNDVRTDLDLRAILPTSLPPLNETSLEPALPSSLPSFTNDGEIQDNDEDDSISNSDNE